MSKKSNLKAVEAAYRHARENPAESADRFDEQKTNTIRQYSGLNEKDFNTAIMDLAKSQEIDLIKGDYSGFSEKEVAGAIKMPGDEWHSMYIAWRSKDWKTADALDPQLAKTGKAAIEKAAKPPAEQKQPKGGKTNLKDRLEEKKQKTLKKIEEAKTGTPFEALKKLDALIKDPYSRTGVSSSVAYNAFDAALARVGLNNSGSEKQQKWAATIIQDVIGENIAGMDEATFNALKNISARDAIDNRSNAQKIMQLAGHKDPLTTRGEKLAGTLQGLLDSGKIAQEHVESTKKVIEQIPGHAEGGRKNIIEQYEGMVEKVYPGELGKEAVATTTEAPTEKPKSPLWNVGENRAADSIVTATHGGKEYMLAIERQDGSAALPGGFVDQNQEGMRAAKEAAMRELVEETELELPAGTKAGYVGYFDEKGRDPRDDDERWVTSRAFSFDLGEVETLPHVKGADDARKADWMTVEEFQAKKPFADHGKILEKSLETFPIGRGGTTKEEALGQWKFNPKIGLYEIDAEGKDESTLFAAMLRAGVEKNYNWLSEKWELKNDKKTKKFLEKLEKKRGRGRPALNPKEKLKRLKDRRKKLSETRKKERQAAKKERQEKLASMSPAQQKIHKAKEKLKRLKAKVAKARAEVDVLEGRKPAKEEEKGKGREKGEGKKGGDGSVKEHTRTLASGKVITIKAHSRRKKS